MANLDLKVLEAALSDRVFDQPLRDSQKLYYSNSISTAWRILQVIEDRSELGIQSDAIAVHLKMNRNTVKMYLRWLEAKKLIESKKQNQTIFGPALAWVYFRIY